MLYVAQLSDGNDRVAMVITASSDQEAQIRAEQWRDVTEWDPFLQWEQLKIWRLGAEVATTILLPGRNHDSAFIS